VLEHHYSLRQVKPANIRNGRRGEGSRRRA
jgi:hypothetical protein